MSVKTAKYKIPDSSPLSQYAEHYVEYSFSSDRVHPFLPEGCFELLISTQGEFLNQSKGDEKLFKRPSCFIGGLHSEIYHVQPQGSDEASCVGIQLKPGKALALLNDRLGSFKNKVVDLALIIGDSVYDLQEELSKKPTSHSRFQLIEKAVVHRARDRNIKLPEELINYMEVNSFMPIRDLSRKFNFSISHFRKLFYDEIGLSPKEYMKVLRVNNAARAVQSGGYDRLTDLCYQLGYYDQSHFIRDFKSVTKVSPARFRSLFEN